MAVKCVVCGMESDRADWVGKKNPQCDVHAQDAQEQKTPPAPKKESTKKSETY